MKVFDETRPRFRIVCSGGVYEPFELQFRRHWPFGRWRRVYEFKTMADANDYYESVKFLPEYLA